MAGNFAAAIPHREEERGGGCFGNLTCIDAYYTYRKISKDFLTRM
jgi:hypothetical protein